VNRTWPALLLAPVFALASIGFGYALVSPACERGQAWLLQVSTLSFLALCIASTLLAWRSMRGHSGLLPLISTWNGIFFSAVVLLQWAAQLILWPCMH
jgi:hypothetical protein